MRLYSTASFRSAAMHLLSSFMLVCFLLGLSTVAQAVELKLNGTKTLLSGSECGLASYRLGTQNSYAGKNLDLILEITEEDNDYVGPCVQLTGNQVSFYLRDEDAADNAAYMDLKFTVVEKNTMTPVEVDRILVTNFDLDRSGNLSLSATDDVYYKDADGAYISSNSLVQYSEGSFFGGKYNAKMRGKDNGNCNDGTTTTDVTCRAAAIWINGPSGANKVSTIYARAQNDNAYGTYNHPQALRLIQFSFELVHFQGLVTVGSDYGDAPNSYGSAGHKSDVNIGLGYGEIADSEAAHQGSTNADGDDTDATGFDDDNAVTIGGADLQGQSLPAETTQNLLVRTFGTGYLNAWVDWNRDGDFNDANEHVLDDQHITTTSVANNTIPLAIPAAVRAGNSYMRFRFSTASGVAASGYSASAGEVEDYLVVLDAPEDYGDAPLSYGEAAHNIPSSNSTWLGTVASPDEGTGSFSSDAMGDDSDGVDDEDAFDVLPTLAIVDTDYSLSVTCVGEGATVAAWIDTDQSDTFEASERSSAICSSGKATLSWNSLSGLSIGSAYARLRIATNAADVVEPVGGASDGEVEDYVFEIVQPDYDFGDAPNDGADFNYGEAKHILPAVNELSIGVKNAVKDDVAELQTWTTEWTGNSSASEWFVENKEKRKKAKKPKKDKKDKKDKSDDPEDNVEERPAVTGDGDEEDGLAVTAYTWSNNKSCTGLLPDGSTGTITMKEDSYCITAKATNSSSVSGQFVAWIDFNQNGVFDDPSERSVVDVDADPSNDDTQGNVPPGTNNEDVVLYWENLDKLSGDLNTFIRMRFTTDPEFKSNNSPSPIGVAINGEVEDTAIGINAVGTDYGDAPNSYGDASHIIELYTYLGTTIDNEATSKNAANGGSDGTGDDVVDTLNHNYDDDDGVASLPALTTQAQSYQVDVTATAPTTEDATLVGWIDFDGNGTFDTDEAATVVVPQNTDEGIVTLSWSTIPSDIKASNSYLRLRITTDATIATGVANTSLPAGLAIDGEVEDYALDIQGVVDITKATSTPTITAGDFAEYTITATNNTFSTVEGVVITDTPADVGFSYHSSSVTLLNSDTTNIAPTRTSTVDPADVDNPMSWGMFTIPPGDAVQINVKMNVFSGVGVYDNSADLTTITPSTLINNFDGNASTVDDVEVVDVVCNASSDVQIFYGSSNKDIYALKLSTGEQRVVTRSALVPAGINALATNPDNGNLVYYGDDTRVYYWDPSEGSDSSAHHLMKELNGFQNFAGTGLDSGGGAYLDGVYYVGSEVLATGGTIVDIFALTLSADGKDVVDAQPIGVMAASGNSLGGFGDFIVTSEGLQGTVYGSTDAAGFWKFDIATKQYQRLGPYLGQVAADQNGQLWRGASTFNPVSLAGVVTPTPSYTPLSAIYDVTGPFPCPQIDNDVFDFGDAPSSYGDASHYIPSTVTTYLGTVTPDDELTTNLGGDAGAGADGDETSGSPDEDGISAFPEINDLAQTYSIPSANITSNGAAATLHAWIDFDGNGKFDNDEYTSASVGAALTWGSVPADIKAGDTYARFRLTTDPNITADTPDGQAGDGEVEDYPLFIKVGGFPVKGRVYNDANVDGVNDTSEEGIDDLPIVLVKIEPNPANNTCVSTRTNADGSYEFFPVIPGDYQLYEASLQKVPVPDNCGVVNVKDPQDYRSTTPSVLNQFSVVDAEITGKDFGDVKMPVFDPDHVDSVMPGNTVHYAHKFTAKSSGDVTFSQNNSAQAGWSSTLFADSNCNGSLDSAESQLSIASAISVTEGADICLINKVYAPANAVVGDRYSNEIIADFDYGNATAGTVSLKVTDLTTALASNDSGGDSKLELRKTVQVYRGSPLSEVSAETETQSAAEPGDVLQYRIYYSNSGTAELTDLVINDVVPEFTVLYGSPSCEMPLPASLNTCTPSVSGDDIEWLFPANDALQGGQSGMVSYQVQVE